MPTSTAIDRVLGRVPAERLRTAAPTPRPDRCRRAHGAPSLRARSPSATATSSRWSMVFTTAGVRVGEQATGRDTDVAEQRDRDRVETADRVGIGVDLDDRLVRRDAGVVRERCAEHDQQVGLVHVPRRDRRAAAAQDAARERMVVGDDSLRLERREDRCVQTFGEADDVVDALACSVPQHDHGSLRAGDQRARPARSDRRPGRRRDPELGRSGRPARASGAAGSACTSSGSTRWATPRCTSACLHARFISST